MTTEFAKSSNEALKLRLREFKLSIAKLMLIIIIGRTELDENLLESEEELRLTRPWNPEFTYPIFGTEEQIYGYKNLQISVCFLSLVFTCLLTITSARYGFRFFKISIEGYPRGKKR